MSEPAILGKHRHRETRSRAIHPVISSVIYLIFLLTLCPQRGAFVSEPAILVKRKSRSSQIWSLEKLENKVIDMRDMYEERQAAGGPMMVDESFISMASEEGDLDVDPACCNSFLDVPASSSLSSSTMSSSYLDDGDDMADGVGVSLHVRCYSRYFLRPPVIES